MKLKYLHDQDPWLLGEDIPDCDIFFFQLPASMFVNNRSYNFIAKNKKFLGVYKKFNLKFYIGEKDSYDVAEDIIKALVNRKGFGKDLDNNIMKHSQKLIDFSASVDAMPLESYTNKKLWQIYKKHDDIHTKLYTYGWLPVAMDLYHSNFTNRLKAYLKTVCKNIEEVEDAFVVLTSPAKKTIVSEEREDFLHMYLKHKQEAQKYKKVPRLSSFSVELRGSLGAHARKWGHMGYIYAGNHGDFGPQHYAKEMIDFCLSGIDAKKSLQNDAKYIAKTRQKKQALQKRLKISKLYRDLFDSAADFAISKLFRRHAQLFMLHRLHRSLLAEIAKRLKLTRYQAQFMLKDEVRDALLDSISKRNIIRTRTKSCVYYAEAGKEIIFIGQKAKKIAKQAVVAAADDVEEVKGQTAQPGKARGIVKKIFRARDMKKMNKGDILVSIATDPDVVPAMKKAGAIVTDQGGITAHAAIVSRELGIPCIIGTKIATRVFKDGDEVEVDATRGIIKKCR